MKKLLTLLLAALLVFGAAVCSADSVESVITEPITITFWQMLDNETYDDVPVNASDVPENFKFCKENEICKLLSYKGKVFSVEIPNFIELEVTQTEPGFKGNTATNTLKPATLETGAEIRVPLFINEGDKIRIDTRTGEYMERVKG